MPPPFEPSRESAPEAGFDGGVFTMLFVNGGDTGFTALLLLLLLKTPPGREPNLGNSNWKLFALTPLVVVGK